MREAPPLTWGEGLAAASVAAALALLLLYPVLGDPGGLAIGHPMVDTWNHVWGFWQVGQALSGLESPLHTGLLRWPEGGSLWFIDAFNAAWTLPLQRAFGPIFAYNFALWANLVLAGWGAWLLARHVTGDRWAAAFTAASFEAMPHLLGQLYDGISETLSVGWLPLSLLAMLRFRARPSPGRGALAGLALATCALANWYYGLFAGLAALAFAADALLPGWRRAAVRRRLHWPAAVTLGLSLPALLAFRATLEADDALVVRDPDFVGRTLVGHNMVDLLSFFHPGDFHSPDLLARFDEQMIVVVYLGWTLLSLAALGLRREAAARPWAAGALLSFTLSLGAYLYLDGAYLSLPGVGWLPMPFLFLFEQIPLFSPISHAFRFTVVTQLCLGVMAAAAIAGLARRRGIASARLAAPLSALFLAESLLASPARFPLPAARAEAPAAYASIAGAGAVLDLPVSIQVLARSRYNLYQIEHGRPIPYGLNDPTPPYLYQNPLTRRVIALERSSVDSAAPALPPLELASAREALARDGLAAVVVHGPLYPPAMRERVLELLSASLGPGELLGDRVVFPVWRAAE